MAGYNELRGLRVKYLSADPANPEDGQVWYNSTTGNLRVQGIGVAAWSSASPLSTGRSYVGDAGIQTAGVFFGGYNGTAYVANTEEYNGSGWSTGGNYPHTVTSANGSGTLTAALGAGGYGPTLGSGSGLNDSNEYDGSSWTAGGTMTDSYYGRAGEGTQTATFVAGGRNPARCKIYRYRRI